MQIRLGIACLTCALGVVAACGSDDDIRSEEDARLAYIGLHGMLDRALNLGMDGYNEASSANIPSQSGEGDVSGTITISGQVDQGVSDNKEMRLFIDLVEYRDEVLDEDGEVTGIGIVYDTPNFVDAGIDDDPDDPGDHPFADISLKGIPDGTFSGTLTGTVDMSGDLGGSVTLNLDLAGDIEEVPDTDEEIRRVPGSTTVTGTAESRYGEFEVDLVI